MPSQRGPAYEKELRAWIDAGWLIPYPHKKLGPPKGLIPLMAVVQQSKSKVRHVMDYRELNQYVDTFTADADVCASKLQRWFHHGPNMCLLDLRRAYLQVRVSESLWPFQTVMFAGKRYCLTCLGFGLNLAPEIMKAVINAVLSQEEKMKDWISVHRDDIYVNEDIVSSLHVKAKLAKFGLICKEPERLEDGTRVFGLHVHGKHGSFRWRHRTVLPEVPDALTRRGVFSLCGILVGHLTVFGWLRVVTGIMKRRASMVTKGWDDETTDALLIGMVGETVTRVKKKFLLHKSWS